MAAQSAVENEDADDEWRHLLQSTRSVFTPATTKKTSNNTKKRENPYLQKSKPTARIATSSVSYSDRPELGHSSTSLVVPAAHANVHVAERLTSSTISPSETEDSRQKPSRPPLRIGPSPRDRVVFVYPSMTMNSVQYCDLRAPYALGFWEHARSLTLETYNYQLLDSIIKKMVRLSLVLEHPIRSLEEFMSTKENANRGAQLRVVRINGDPL